MAAEPEFEVVVVELEKGLLSPEEDFELRHEVVAAEPEFEVVVAGLEKGPHLPEVLES